MVKDSLDKYLSKFPYFLDKNKGSNFYKVSKVNNEIFKNLYNDLFKVYDSFHLRKKLLIWKEQVEPYSYKINFIANYPNLKEVKIYKNDELIYIESYQYDDLVDYFKYTYICTYDNDFVMEDNSLNLNEDDIIDEEIIGDDDEEEDDKNIPIIPADKFRMYVETYNEYTFVKGFPENDEIKNDEFDHDYSLDEFGDLNNIPRKNYIDVDDIGLYPLTEPPFNNRETEDDYHYMNRILEYNKRIFDTPAPVLEIWKLYGLDAVMLNRERLLIKLFDEDNHSDDKGNVDDWVPEKWEHKDKFCDYDSDLGKYFFVDIDNIAPPLYTNVNVRFLLYNSLAELVDDDFTVTIEHYIQGREDRITTIDKGCMSKEVVISYKVFDIEEVNVLRFTIDSNDEIKNKKVECVINVRGCDDGDWYVNAENGDDVDGDGSEDNPFKTLEKAISVVNKALDLIVVQDNIVIDTEEDIPIVNANCTILGCGDTYIESNVNRRFFKINGMKNINLNLINITLKNEELSAHIKTKTFINQNKNYNDYETVLIYGGSVEFNINLNKNEYYPFDFINVLGHLETSKGVNLPNKEIEVYWNNVDSEGYLDKILTNDDGDIDTWVNLNHSNVGEEGILYFDFNNDNYFRNTKNVPINIIPAKQINVVTGDSCVLNSEGYTPNSTVIFHNSEGDRVGSAEADANGNVSFEFTPDLGHHIIYTYKVNYRVANVFDEWFVLSYITIDDLDNNVFVTGMELVDDKDIIVTVKSVEKLRDLDGIITGFRFDDGEIILDKYELPFDEYTDDELDDNKLSLKELDVAKIGINFINFIYETGDFEIIWEND